MPACEQPRVVVPSLTAAAAQPWFINKEAKNGICRKVRSRWYEQSNWLRSSNEVAALITLLLNTLRRCRERLA